MTKMYKFYIVLQVLLVLICKIVSPREVKCPSHCKCDIFEKYRRATCQHQSLIVVEADVPPQVEFLDLSYNMIHELHDHKFSDLNLTCLKLLNLSHNKIGQIHINAFSNMNNIKTIDLSYNRIEYLLENWFWHVPLLEELYLQENNLRRLQQGPILESRSVKILDLSGCSLLDIHDDAFSKLPNLEILNLSRNNLIHLNAKLIKPLLNLQILALENNTWHCNDITTDLTNYCKKNRIHCKGWCPTSTPIIHEEKFQRMVIQPHTETYDEQLNSWIYDDNINNRNNIIKETCSTDGSTNTAKDLLMEVIELSPILSLFIPFAFGLALGLIIACGVAMKQQHQISRNTAALKHRSSIIRNQTVSDLYECPLMQPESFEVCDTTPMPLRKTHSTVAQNPICYK